MQKWKTSKSAGPSLEEHQGCGDECASDSCRGQSASRGQRSSSLCDSTPKLGRMAVARVHAAPLGSCICPVENRSDAKSTDLPLTGICNWTDGMSNKGHFASASQLIVPLASPWTGLAIHRVEPSADTTAPITFPE